PPAPSHVARWSIPWCAGPMPRCHRAASLFAGDHLLVATLKSEALIRVRLSGSDGQYRATEIQRWFVSSRSSGRYGRLRDVVLGPDGSLYVLTSNRNGRGRSKPGDDRICHAPH